MPALQVTDEELPLARPFRIARGVRTATHVVTATLTQGAHTGRGECVPYARYDETVESVCAQVESVRTAIEAGADRAALQDLLPAGAARNAVDAAFWDLESKASGQRAWERAGVPAPPPTVTAETIGIDAPVQMAIAAGERAEHPLLKVKLDGEQVVERVEAVRAAAPHSQLVVDANEAWDRALLDAVVEPLHQLGVTMIEQPLPAADDAALEGYAGPITLCADESCHTRADLDGLIGRYGMVNIKLDKTGGLTEALALADAARGAGMELMVGCMVASSLSMAPATLLCAAARVVDLDGPLWLAADRQPALAFTGGMVHPPDAALWG